MSRESPRNGDQRQKLAPHRCGRFADERRQRQFGRPQTEDAGRRKKKAYAAMQEVLKTSRPQKTPQVPRKLRIQLMTLPVSELHDKMAAQAAEERELLPPCKRTSMQPKPNTTGPSTG